MSERLKNKVAIVTGAGRGMGRAHCLALAAEGAKIVVGDPGLEVDGTGGSTSPADEVVAEIRGKGGMAIASYDSVTSWEAGQRITKIALDNFGRLDILVNNAGILRDRMIFNMSEEEWDAVLKVHLYGHFYTTQAACGIMRQQKNGRIINISSTSGMGAAGQVNYCAAKEGIIGFTRGVALDMQRYGVTCNAIRPGGIATRMTISEKMHKAAEDAKARGDAQFITQLAEIEKHAPEDVSPMVVYLSTDEAYNINGCVFFVEQGIVGLYPEPTLVKTIFKDSRWTVDELTDLIPRTLAAGIAPRVLGDGVIQVGTLPQR